MKKRIIDDDMPIGKLTPVPDFLPPPHKLVLPKQTVKVTLTLSTTSIAFFKAHAKKNHVKYQTMIREVVDRYAKQAWFGKKAAS